MGSVRAARERIGINTDDRLSAESVDPPNPVWPLGGNGNNFAQSQPRGAPPQRPPRPNYVPSLLPDTQRQESPYSQAQESSRNPILPQQAKYWEPNYTTSAPHTPITPVTTSSRDSVGSSVGSIPDFPVPSIPAQLQQPAPRRSANIGPPPTQRRGPSSYYSQASFVAPIPEEGTELSQQGPYHTGRRMEVESYNWQEDGSNFYIDRDSTISAPGEHLVEPVGLVRNASMGKQYKPLLTTIRPTSQTLHQQKGHAAPQLTVVDRSHLAAEHTVFVESVDSDDEPASAHGGGSMERTAFLRSQPAGSDTRTGTIIGEKELLVSSHDERELRSPQRNSRIIYPKTGGTRDGASLATGSSSESISGNHLKPTPFEFKDEPTNRASMASLTDLLKRATRVRTNLEKGRTASRLGLRDFLNLSKPDLLTTTKDEPARDSLTDMLESFPPPAAITPPRQSPTRDPPQQTTQTDGRWHSPFANSSGNPIQSSGEQKQYEQPSKPRKRNPRHPHGRRCCGLPLWGFILCIVLLLVLTAAAVLIPIFLIVIPDQSKANAVCSNSFPCSNNGYSFTSSTGCQCICAGGFTGSQCTQVAPVTSDCAAATFGPYQQVTVGTKVLPLITPSAQFSIPINNTILLANFSSAKLYCGDENNLITFVNAGTPKKRDLQLPVAVPAEALARRASAMTTAGLIVDQPTATTTGAAPTSTATTPSSSQLEFAQTAILYIFQQTSLDIANNIRQALDTAFSNGAWLGPVVTNSNITVDLRLFKVTAGGATVGSGP